MLSFNHLFHVLRHVWLLYTIYITVDTGVTYSVGSLPHLWALQLGSDFQSSATHTGLTLSPARCNFCKMLTLSVNVFVIYF